MKVKQPCSGAKVRAWWGTGLRDVESDPFLLFLRPLRVLRDGRIFRTFRLLRGLRGMTTIVKTLAGNPAPSTLSLYLPSVTAICTPP